MADEGEIPAGPFLGIKSPELDEQVIEPLIDDELRKLLKVCAPPRDAAPQVALRDRRDEALIRLMLETGIRAGEVVALQLDDVDLADEVVTVRRGGRQGTARPFGAGVALAIDRCGCAAATVMPTGRPPRAALLGGVRLSAAYARADTLVGP